MGNGASFLWVGGIQSHRSVLGTHEGRRCFCPLSTSSFGVRHSLVLRVATGLIQMPFMVVCPVNTHLLNLGKIAIQLFYDIFKKFKGVEIYSPILELLVKTVCIWLWTNEDRPSPALPEL